jgi:solute carrier family 35 protein E3
MSGKANGYLAAFYCLFNIIVASAIVFANKAVFSLYHFKFVFALTLIHTIFTWVGMSLLAGVGFFFPKKIPAHQLLPLAIGYVGYIVLCNLSLNLNSVGFYQIMKVAVAPTVLLLEIVMFHKIPSFMVVCSVVVVCAGITVATITDPVVVKNSSGLIVGIAATLITALYQIWVGSKQKELEANSSQLLLAYTPQATLLLSVLVPIFEPMGWRDQESGTLLGFTYSFQCILAIVISAILGVLVSLSTFLVIGSTSSLSYNIIGHLKTVIILSGGVLFFEDVMGWKRLAGICIAMAGIGWYTQMTIMGTAQSQIPAAKTTSPLQIKSKGELQTPFLETERSAA